MSFVVLGPILPPHPPPPTLGSVLLQHPPPWGPKGCRHQINHSVDLSVLLEHVEETRLYSKFEFSHAFTLFFLTKLAAYMQAFQVIKSWNGKGDGGGGRYLVNLISVIARQGQEENPRQQSNECKKKLN